MNPLDNNLKLPEEFANTKKPIFKEIRKLFKKPENESIETEFDHLTNLETIENDIFENVEEDGLFVLRIYVKHNVLETLTQKIMGGLAVFTQEMGAAHIGIQIADRIVHWLGCGFALVKDWKGAGATALFYPQSKDDREIGTLICNKEVRINIAKVIQKWNCSYSYSSKDYNCQIFASEILKVCGLKDSFKSFSGPVGDFIEHISKFENMKKEFHPCIIRDKKIMIKWESHAELDKWHNENKGMGNYESLLKAFHRGYQLKGDYGVDCPCNEPTLLVDGEGIKTNQKTNSGNYTKINSNLNSNTNSNQSNMSQPNSITNNDNKDDNNSTNSNNSSSNSLQGNENKSGEDNNSLRSKIQQSFNSKVDEIELVAPPEGYSDTKKDSPKCMNEDCNKSFGFFVYKYYCDYCKKSFCSNCTKNSIDLPKKHAVPNSFGGSQKQRVCFDCFTNITLYWKKEREEKKKLNEKK